MTRWAVFLRGINVGGAKPVRMAELRARLVERGFSNVATVRASGNVVLDADAGGAKTLMRDVEGVLRELTSGEVRAFVRSADALARAIAAAPFRSDPPDGDTFYVTFLSAPFPSPPTTPFTTPSGKLTVLAIGPLEVYSVSHRIAGRTGFPNPFVEKHTRTPATSRNWSTIGETALACGIRPAAPGRG